MFIIGPILFLFHQDKFSGQRLTFLGHLIEIHTT